MKLTLSSDVYIIYSTLTILVICNKTFSKVNRNHLLNLEHIYASKLNVEIRKLRESVFNSFLITPLSVLQKFPDSVLSGHKMFLNSQ